LLAGERARESAQRQQTAEREAFVTEWKSAGRILKFTKPSPRLLQLREREYKGTITGDYERAAAPSQQADDLEVRGAGQARTRANLSMRTAAGQLRDRQETQAETAEGAARQRSARIETQRRCARMPIEVNMGCLTRPSQAQPPQTRPQTASWRVSIASRPQCPGPGPKGSARDVLRNF
jgi:hypothetical protein